MRGFLDGQFNYHAGIEEGSEPGTYVYTSQMHDAGYQIGDSGIRHRGASYVNLEGKQSFIYRRYGKEDEKIPEEGFEVKSIYDECIGLLNGNYSTRDVNEIQKPESNANGNEMEQKLYMGRMRMDKYYYNCNNGGYNNLFTRKQENLKNEPCAESVFSCAHTEKECMLLIDEARNGRVVRIRRRLSENEKSVIKPGSVFIYKEQESNIKRWTDKREWTPSRVHGAFLVYKELNGMLYKKTFSKMVHSEKYHVVIYSSIEWERTRDCCRVFSKDKNGLYKRTDQRICRGRDEESCSVLLGIDGTSQFQSSSQDFISNRRPGRYSGPDRHSNFSDCESFCSGSIGRDPRHLHAISTNSGRICCEEEGMAKSLDFGCNPIHFSEPNAHEANTACEIKGNGAKKDERETIL